MYHLVIKYQITNETIRFKLQLFENAAYQHYNEQKNASIIFKS